MRILIFESNLMWSSRLARTARGLGHEPVLCQGIPESAGGAQAAIVNLGDPGFDAKVLVPLLQGIGIKVIAHAGHKEKDLLDLGREAGVDVLATNSQLTFKLDDLLRQVEIPESTDADL